MPDQRDWHRLLRSPPTLVYKDDHRSRVWRVDDEDQGTIVFKQFKRPPPRQLLASLLGVHPARRERRWHASLRARALPIVPIVAHGRQWSPLGVCCWLASPYLGESLHRRIMNGRELDARERSRLLDAAAQLTASVLRAGFVNRDHKASNVLIDDQGAAWLIDAGGVARQRRGLEAGLERMLAALDQTLAVAGATDVERQALAERTRRHLGTASGHPRSGPKKCSSPCIRGVR